MSEYHIFWLIAIAGGLVSALAVIGFGCWALRRVIEDASNSATLNSWVLRLFRIAPGGALITFGGVLLWLSFARILALAPPGHG